MSWLYSSKKERKKEKPKMKLKQIFTAFKMRTNLKATIKNRFLSHKICAVFSQRLLNKNNI